MLYIYNIKKWLQIYPKCIKIYQNVSNVLGLLFIVSGMKLYQILFVVQSLVTFVFLYKKLIERELENEITNQDCDERDLLSHSKKYESFLDK